MKFRIHKGAVERTFSKGWTESEEGESSIRRGGFEQLNKYLIYFVILCLKLERGISRLKLRR